MTDCKPVRLIPHINSFLWGLNDELDERVEGVIHPSELSWCLRCVYYCRREMKKIQCVPPDLRRTFDTGHALHNLVQGWMTSGAFFDPTDDEGRSNILVEQACGWPDPPIYGHTDGIWVRPGAADIGIELKTINTDGFGRPPISGSVGGHNQPAEGHLQQVHLYMRCTGLEHFIIVYWNKNNGRLKEFWVPWIDEVWDKVQKRLDTVEAAVSAKEPPEGFVTRSCRNCRFSHLCDAEGIERCLK